MRLLRKWLMRWSSFTFVIVSSLSLHFIGWPAESDSLAPTDLIRSPWNAWNGTREFHRRTQIGGRGGRTGVCACGIGSRATISMPYGASSMDTCWHRIMGYISSFGALYTTTFVTWTRAYLSLGRWGKVRFSTPTATRSHRNREIQTRTTPYCVHISHVIEIWNGGTSLGRHLPCLKKIV